ncbi:MULTISPECIES: LysM peptidoglycan-binding domain-containing protein [Mesobacillus]|uniref:LysM peptidoglycan-binding domain-containing protein n=1 Tax=Mesobacillus selenatarsenatis TaxID=388741 RepID=A0A846TL00_9BACI|nr:MULTISPECIES: LysM peptidoglycan-binding domain-containing protein [Mesobacillus]NKE06634.1 LysM peptidoglycan-binding domain-containing protein [Mesobacillus selenatarsenatis]
MKIHVVRPGDTLWRLAQGYQTTINQIILVNELDNPNVLVVGQSLVIPENNREYVVQQGDSLWAIASRYGVTVQEIASYNNIADSAMIFVGQMLELPYLSHTVNSGETLWAISQRYGVSINQITEANNISNPSLIYPGFVLRIPAPAKPTIEVNAYITRMSETGRRDVLSRGHHFTYLSPFSYKVGEDGSLLTLQDTLVLQGAKMTNTSPLLTITNEADGSFSSDRAADILRNPGVQDTLLNNILVKMKEKGYTGLNIDFEYVYPEDRENYNNFLRKAVGIMHPEGYTVSTALAPKQRADQEGLLYEAHDYEAHGEIVDFVVIMTYEWGWSGGRPWAIAPLNEVRKVLDYAVTAIPRDKIMMGVPLYGRDWRIPWVQGTYARTVSPKGAVELAAQQGVNIQYHDTYQSPFFRYTDSDGQQHEVWYEDARSVQAKYDTAKEYGLRGVSYWVLGPSFPQNWPVLQNNFRARKL